MTGTEAKTLQFGNITFIRGKRGGRYPFCNALVVDDRMRVVVDPGAGRSEMLGVRAGRQVDVLINSHYHEDHNCYNYLFPGAQLWAHAAEAAPLSDINAYFRFGCPMNAEARKLWEVHIRERFHYTERPPDRRLNDGDVLQFGDTTARVLHTPGHSPGHIALHFPEADLLFLADIDLTAFGPWYGDNLSDMDALIASVHRVMSLRAKRYLVGHEGGPYEDIRELCRRFLAVIARRDADVLDALRAPATLEQLVSRWVIYRKPREPVLFFAGAERAMLVKHIERLERTGRIRRDGEYLVAE